MKAEPLSAEGDEATFLFNMLRVFSSFIPTVLLEKRLKEWRGGKQLLQNKTTKLPEDHTAGTPIRSVRNTHTHVFLHLRVYSLFFFLYVFLCVVWFWGGICLVWSSVGVCCCFGSCVVSQRRRQQAERERKLDFRETKEGERGTRRRSGGENTTASSSVPVFLYHLWRSVNKLRAGEGARGGRKGGGWGDEGEESSSPVLLCLLLRRWSPQSAHKIQNNHIYSCLLFYICCAVGCVWKWNGICPIIMININTFRRSAGGQHVSQSRHKP